MVLTVTTKVQLQKYYCSAYKILKHVIKMCDNLYILVIYGLFVYFIPDMNHQVKSIIALSFVLTLHSLIKTINRLIC